MASNVEMTYSCYSTGADVVKPAQTTNAKNILSRVVVWFKGLFEVPELAMAAACA